MTFIAHVPGFPLSRAVERFYAPVGPMPYRREFVMPATSMDLKINFGSPVSSRRAESASWESTPLEGWCMGLWDTHHLVSWPSHLEYIGVTFRPGGFLALFGIEAQELANQTVGLDAVLGKFGKELRARLGEAHDIRTRFALLERLLTDRLTEGREVDRVAHAVDALRKSEGALPIAQLATSLNISHKHLVTLFNRVAGASPKTFARLYRFEHLLDVIGAEDPSSWTHIAHDLGFYDQAHFNKEFKRLSGHTPAAYLEQRKRVQAKNPAHAQHRRLLQG